MPSLSGTLVDVTSAPSDATEVWIRAADGRVSGANVVLEETRRVPVNAGKFTVTVLPGRAHLVVIHAGMSQEHVPLLVQDGMTTIAEAVRLGDAHWDEYSPSESEAEQIKAEISAEVANAATRVQDAIKDDMDAAATSAAAAATAADRAETVVDTVQWQGDQLSVMGKVSPPLTGDAGETPYIGANGTWWVGETDTGVRAQGEKGGPGAPGSLGITFVESLAEAEALPVGTLYAIVAEVTTPPTDPEIPGNQVTVAGIASANANTAVIAPTIDGAQPGDTMILAVNTKATSKVTLTPPEGFTTAVDGYWVGTQRSWVLHGPYTPGVQFTFSAEQETAWVAVAVRGAQSIDVGTPKGRAETPADTDTTTTAPAVSKRDLDLVLGLVFERSTTTESADQVTVSAGWEKIAWQGHGQNVQTVLAARAITGGNLVATYPNPQAQNSLGVQVACRA